MSKVFRNAFTVMFVFMAVWAMAEWAMAEEKMGVPVYSGAKIETAKTKENMENFKTWDIQKEIVFYNTTDSFDKVYKYYAKHYKKEPKILTGADITPGISDESKRAEFILDKKAKTSHKAKLLLVVEHIIDEEEPNSKTEIVITKSTK